MQYKVENRQDIQKLCNKYRIEKYKINPDLSINVDGNVRFNDVKLTHIPLKFGTVSGYFSLYECGRLISLENAPYHVGSHFDCDNNKLTSLQYAPRYVGGYFTVIENRLTSLEYLPEIIKGSIHFSDNEYVENDAFYQQLENLLLSPNYESYNDIAEIYRELPDPAGFKNWQMGQQRIKTIQDIIES